MNFVMFMGTIYIVNVCSCYGYVDDLVSAASTGVLSDRGKVYRHACTDARTHAHARTHARTHTHARSHIHTYTHKCH